MNRLSTADRAKILGMLVEGNSLRSCARMADVSLNTVTKLLVDLGAACEQFHDERVRNVRVRRLQADEIWCFIGAKAKNVTPEQKAEGWGDVWTWTGLDADTKLCVSYLVGGRSADWAIDFMKDAASRIRGPQTVTGLIWKQLKRHSERMLITRSCRRFTAHRRKTKRATLRRHA
jgi:hypothetical protein